MIFVIDIGNTNTVLGVFANGKLYYQWRIKTDRYKTEDEFAMIFKSLFNDRGLSFSQVESIVISSGLSRRSWTRSRRCARNISI